MIVHNDKVINKIQPILEYIQNNITKEYISGDVCEIPNAHKINEIKMDLVLFVKGILKNYNSVKYDSVSILFGESSVIHTDIDCKGYKFINVCLKANHRYLEENKSVILLNSSKEIASFVTNPLHYHCITPVTPYQDDKQFIIISIMVKDNH